MSKGSKSNQRWPAVQALLELGYKVDEVAQAIGCSAATVRNDVRDRGGMQVLFPDRPNPNDAYAKCFEVYVTARRPDRTDDLWVNTLRGALERKIGLVELRYFAEGLRNGVNAMQTPAWLKDDDPACRFMEKLFGGAGTTIDFVYVSDMPFLLATLFEQVAEGTESSPSSLKEAMETLARIARTTSHRQNLYAPTPGNLQETVEAVIDTLPERDRSIIRMRNGFDGPPESCRAIGNTLGLSGERINQIERTAMKHLLEGKQGGRLRAYMQTAASLREDLQDTRNDLEIALANAAAAVRDRDDLVELLTAGLDPVFRRMRDIENAPPLKSSYFKRIDELDISVRAYNGLNDDGIEFIWQLVTKTEAYLLKMKNFGRKSLNEVKELLATLGHRLGTELPETVLEEVQSL